MNETRIPVGGDQPYEVVVGTDLLEGELPALVGKRAETVAVIHDERLAPLAEQARRALADAGYHVHVTAVPSGEAAKDVTVLARLWSWLADAKVTRSDCVVGLGGGATTDLAGFAAASWLRGVPVVQVPTTVLGMVDAAVGGKTAIDIPAGKNLVGAFHPPAGVLADLSTLETLPRVDYVAGLAEVIKTGFIADGEILRLIAADPQDATGPQGRHSRELIERSIRHGDAVAIGMVFAAEVARLAGKLTQQDVALHKEMLTSVGLPVTYRADAWPELRPTMSLDKKARGARLRMIILDGVGNPVTYDSPPEDLLTEAYQAVAG
jgi:3-dehydroquinate synthase